MFFSLIKSFFKDNDEIIVDSINVINRINKICKIAKNVTGEINSDKAIANIKKNKQHKYAFLKALRDADASFYEDRINARSRDLELTDRYGANKRANFMLFFVCIGLSASIFSIICFKNYISSEMLAVITGVIGVLSGCLKEAFEFEFGGGKNDKKFQTKALGLDVPTEEALIQESSVT